ncbi:MAG: dockerin type I repeat-containing protein, partial [Clostridia bacterium]|nr:dockerin type I repeat-containing protein [Clostridia bacterium]
FDPAAYALYYDFKMVSGSKSNIILFFKNSNTTSYQKGQYLSIQSYIDGAVISSGSGDIKGDDVDHVGKIDLSGVDFPADCYNADGTLTLNAIRIYASGTANMKSYFRSFAITNDLRDTSTNFGKSESLIREDALTLTDTTHDGGYVYDNGKLIVTSYTSSGFEMAVNLNKAVKVTQLKNWLMDVKATTRFDIKLKVTTSAADASYGLVSDFYTRLCSAPENGCIPAGEYAKSFDLLSCYSWNQVVPSDGVSTIKQVIITLGGKGSLTIDALALSDTTDTGRFADGVTSTRRTRLGDVVPAALGTTVQNLIGSGVTVGTLTVYDASGNKVTSGVIKTGMTIKQTLNGGVVSQGTIAAIGDVSGDGALSTNDARMIVGYVVGGRNFTDAQKAAADYNGDNTVTVTDVRRMLLSITG